MTNKLSFLIVVAGPTAVGKTSVTIDLAQHYQTQIISADSRQFFKEMSIGTAKPSSIELSKVPHHFIDSHSVRENFSAGQFEAAALHVLRRLFLSHRCVFVTGGSGLYIDALVNGLPNIPEANKGVREELNKQWKEKGLALLTDELRRVDPAYYDRVDKANPMRVIRGLEVFRSTGKPFSHYHSQKRQKRDFEVIKIGLSQDREELYSKIDERVNTMIRHGLFEEVKALLNYRNVQALQTVGYKEVIDYFDHRVDKKEAITLIKRNTRRYAKRQLTWFRKDKTITWFHPSSVKNIIDFIDSKIAEK